LGVGGGGGGGAGSVASLLWGFDVLVMMREEANSTREDGERRVGGIMMSSCACALVLVM
jgi:hypothetical protein